MTTEEAQLKEFNDKWQIHQVISEALANAHTQPAPKTLEMLEEIRATQATQATTLAVQNEKHNSIDSTLQEIKKTTSEVLEQTKKTNGRVTAQEAWSANAQQLLEKVIKDSSDNTKDYTINKTRLWTAVTLLVFLGGTIIALSVLAIDSKIEKGIQTALDNKVESVQYAK